jgi:hypothetical protein
MPPCNWTRSGWYRFNSFCILDVTFSLRFHGLAPFHEFVTDRNFHRSTFWGNMRKGLPLAVSCADA